jgi:hypothetical protein
VFGNEDKDPTRTTEFFLQGHQTAAASILLLVPLLASLPASLLFSFPWFSYSFFFSFSFSSAISSLDIKLFFSRAYFCCRLHRLGTVRGLEVMEVMGTAKGTVRDLAGATATGR